MDEQKLSSLLKKSEGPKLDFKNANGSKNQSPEKKKLAKDVIAIANSQGGRGHLIVGVEDKTKRIVGIIPSDYNEERIQQIVGNRCDPPLNLRVEYVEMNDKIVLVVTVLGVTKTASNASNWCFYIRRGSTTDVARRDEIASLLQTGGIIHNEQIPVFNVDMNVLNMDLIQHYLGRMNMPNKGDIDKSLLANLGIIHYDRDEEIYNPTVGGMLLFCDSPQIYLPHTGVTIIDFRGRTRTEYHIGDLSLSCWNSPCP